MMYKALITGGSGFLGKALIKNLDFNGYKVYTFDSGTGKDNHIQGNIVNFDQKLL